MRVRSNLTCRHQWRSTWDKVATESGNRDSPFHFEQLVGGIYIILGTSMLPLPFLNCLCIVAHLVNQPSGLCGWTTHFFSL